MWIMALKCWMGLPEIVIIHTSTTNLKLNMGGGGEGKGPVILFDLTSEQDLPFFLHHGYSPDWLILMTTQI